MSLAEVLHAVELQHDLEVTELIEENERLHLDAEAAKNSYAQLVEERLTPTILQLTASESIKAMHAVVYEKSTRVIELEKLCEGEQAAGPTLTANTALISKLSEDIQRLKDEKASLYKLYEQAVLAHNNIVSIITDYRRGNIVSVGLRARECKDAPIALVKLNDG